MEMVEDSTQTRKKQTVQRTPVVIRGIDVPFGDLVLLLVKVAIASIPALLILGFLGAILAAMLGGIGHVMR